MKKIIIGLFACLALLSCKKQEVNPLWTDKTTETVRSITGEYTMVSALWSAQADFSGNGTIGNDVLEQMDLYGWMGTQRIKRYGEEYVSILNRSVVCEPSSGAKEAYSQVNLYIPVSDFTNKLTGRPDKNGRCTLNVIPFQFHYWIDADGQIELKDLRDFHPGDEHMKLENVDIVFKEGSIFFNADSVLYDWARDGWQEGHISIEFVCNE